MESFISCQQARIVVEQQFTVLDVNLYVSMAGVWLIPWISGLPLLCLAVFERKSFY